MTLSNTDWIIIASFFVVWLLIGFLTSKRAGKNPEEFFLSGRNMPWWLLGVSMVATTFSADTPNLVTDIVRKNGVAGNWAWWAFLLTGMLTVFVYARLWRRSGVGTDLEFYELRYGGKKAAFLRGFRALYLGVFFNIMIMASVSLAAIKIGAVLLGLSPMQTMLIASVVTVAYSSMGGLRSVLITDFFQFFVAMAGSIAAAYVLLQKPEIGSLSGLLSHANVSSKISLLPDFNDSSAMLSLLVIPLAIQWWSVWYPGAEPGGGGYIAQRMLSAKDEKNALAATLLFNIAHYALRPWPWIIIALASLILFPNLESLQAAFPHIGATTINDDLAYPAMLSFLPAGLLGIVIASLVAAYMSTISTHLNWGSSYVVNDFYKRFIKPQASDKELVNVGRLSTVVLMIISALFALVLTNALQAFQILLQIGAGTGLIFILRWFWWRINAWTEITGMAVSFILAIYLQIIHPKFFDALPDHISLMLGIGLTTLSWIIVTFITKPEDEKVLISFYKKIKPAAWGWKKLLVNHPNLQMEKGQTGLEVVMMLAGCMLVYGLLFCTGYSLYGKVTEALITGTISVISSFIIIKNWKLIKFN